MSAAARAPLDRRRLAHVLDRLGSNFDGESLAAARLAIAIVRAAGISWDELLDPRPAFPAPPAGPLNVDAILRAALARSGRLTSWENNFVRDLAGRRPRGLSERQAAQLARLAGKVGIGR